MITSFFRFIFELALLTAIVLPANYFILEEIMKIDFSGLHYFIYLYFAIMVVVIHVVMSRALKNRPQNYIVSFMAAMGIKMFLSLGILVIIMYSGLNELKSFAINYLILYFIFSTFSFIQMHRAQGRISEKK